MLNSIGLQGPGISAFVDKDLAWLKQAGARTMVSIAGNTSGEFADVAAMLRASDAFDAVVGVEVNISCPNVANRGLVFACDPMASAKVVALVREQLPTRHPDLRQAHARRDRHRQRRAGLREGRSRRSDDDQDAAGQRHRDRPAAAAGGGCDRWAVGPAIRPVAVRAIWQTGGDAEGRLLTVPIIGVGGVRTVGTPSGWSRPARARSRWARRRSTTRAPGAGGSRACRLLQDKGFERLTDAVGVAHRRLVSP